MTKLLLCDKILCMKIYKNFLTKILIVTMALAFSFAILFACNPNIFIVKASSLSDNRLIPTTELENMQLTSPLDTYSDDEISVIIQEDEQSLLIYSQALGWSKKTGFSDLKQVKRFNDKIIFSDYGNIYYLPIENYNSHNAVQYKDNNLNSIGSSCFDCYGNYLVTTYNTVLKIFYLENDILTLTKEINNVNGSIVACNSEFVFYISSDGVLKKCSLTSIEDTSVNMITYGVSTIKTIISDENYLYFSSENKIHRVSIETHEIVNYSIKEDEYNTYYDLGKFATISDISFRNNNLLITDNNKNAVQEFEIIGNQLVFTGFAIAKNLTAFNRISKTAYEIEKYGNTVAVLDSNKLTIILSDQNFNSNNKSNFKNYFVNTFNPQEKPVSFALGNNTVAVTFKDGFDNFSLSIFDINNQTYLPVNIPEIAEDNYSVKDICYQTGYYYVLKNNGINSKVIRINENDFSDILTLTNLSDFSAELMCVDVLGNLYFANATHIYKNNTSTIICEKQNITKMDTDLVGTLFVLDNGNLKFYNQNTNSLENCNITQTNIASFSMSFDNNTIYYLVENEEYIYKTNQLNNIAINSLQVPTNCIISNTSINDNLKAYTVVENSNIYLVDIKDDLFNFVKLEKESTEYVFICEVTIPNSSVEFYALAEQNGVVLVNTLNLIEKNITYSTVTEKAFITTGVSCYYYPIITKDSLYLLAGENTRLTRGDIISPTRMFNFLNRDFYEVAFDNGLIKCYVPVASTTKVLSDKNVFKSYAIEQVFATDVYSDKSLDSSTKMFSIEDGQTIRVFSIEDSVAKIMVNVNDVWLEGYISSSSIKDKPQTIVRNILIILAVIACSCGSISYFLLRKKQ